MSELARSKWGIRRNDLYFQVTGDVAKFELVFSSRELVRVDWFSVGRLMLVG